MKTSIRNCLVLVALGLWLGGLLLGSPVGSVAGAGSFPRSFLIPGTDTSIRIGGS